MPVQPDSRVQQIEFAESHWPIWNVAPASVGLTPAAVTAIKNAAGSARTAWSKSRDARDASKAATIAYYNETDNMKSLVAEAIKAIRLYAQSTNNPNVYSAAQIPVPAQPSPLPPPGQPTDVTATVEPTGALTLTWTATSEGSGAVYLVRRRLHGQSNFALIGAAQPARNSRFKTFTDDTLPAGANDIDYIIQGQRGGEAGPDSRVFNVTLGGSGAGLMITATGMSQAA
jgi:hypothetical protein